MLTQTQPILGTASTENSMRVLASVLIGLLGCSGAFAQGSAFTVDLGSGDGERRTVNYECEGRDPLTVTYLNVAPNFLAIMPIEEQTFLFATVAAGRDTHYASGQWVWTVSGVDGTLTDASADDYASPVAECTEIINTP